jgi:diguanylate cyclase (GGDEF)-like protein
MKNSVRSKIIYRAAFLAIGITCISFFITFYLSYEVSVNSAEQQIGNILDAIEKSASVGIYADNEAISEDVISGLLRSDLICSVEIRDAAGKTIHAEARKSGAECDERLERKVPSPFDPAEWIGSILVRVNHGSLVRLSRNNSIINSAITAVSLIVTAAICILMVSRWIIRPLLGISRQLQAIGARRDNRISFELGDSELTRLVHDINTLLDHRDAAEDVILQQLNYDPLTQLPNRRLLRDRLETAINLSQRNASKVAVLLMDFDGFKEVNDQFGHDVGDKLLIQAAERMVKAVRKSDTVARLGGDEFAVILPDVKQGWQAEGVSEELIRTVDAPFTIGSATAHVTASIGLTWFPDDGETAETLMKNADQAMYSAKAAGGNRFHWFTAAMQRAAAERHQLTLDLRHALQNAQLDVHYQPIIDLATGEIVNAEALLRWNHPVRGMIPPSDFISLAEESGLIMPIGDWVFRRAAATAKDWLDWARQAGRATDGRSVHISVNTSSRQFQMGFDGVEWLGFLDEIGLPAQHVTIEITESLFIENDQNTARTLNRLRDRGVRIAIDDFGTGYSSLGYLQKLPIDYIKIDRSFISNIDNSENDKSIVDAILALAQKLDLSVVAEGIERESQREFLRQSGCAFGQGWLMFKPMSEADFKALLRHRLSRAGSAA